MRSSLFALLFVSAVWGCDQGRLPLCKTDSDCTTEDGGPGTCYNLKCVQCRNDSNCPAGSVCADTSNTCSVIDDRIPEPDGGAVGWESSPHDECVKACKDPSCIKGCDTKFPKAGKTR